MGRPTGRGATRTVGARLRTSRVVVTFAALAILPLVGALAPVPQAALAAPAASTTTYPSWQDVAKAQANEAAAAKAVAAIKALLTKLTAEVKATQAEADAKG